MTPQSIDTIELSNLDWWTGPLAERESAFAQLRAEQPIAQMTHQGTQHDEYWSLTRHADIIEVSRSPELFCSSAGTQIADVPVRLREFFGSMIAMDDPRHARLRRIVSRGFTPRQLAALQADVEQVATEVVDAIAERGSCDFVTDVAALIPLRVILDLMGISRSDEQFVVDRTNLILGFNDPEYVPDGDDPTQASLEAATDLAALVQELGEARARDPRDDLITLLVTSTPDGEYLTPEELASFFILLVGAGNETTRQAIAHGLWLLSEHPDERARWMADPDLTPTAVDEIVRVASPVLYFRRTVTRDGVDFHDHTFSEGDKVVLWYWSANRDEAVFADPQVFDVGRKPNDHVGFGGPGPHYCLGAHLARREIAVTFAELFRRLPDIHAVGEPDRLRSNFLNGIKHMRAEWTPSR